MDFTIITPNFNYGNFLDECLRSVSDQKGVTYEHLVYDAGSTDDSAYVASKFPHLNWISESDSGMSEAINKGFNQAKGDWVMWLNADDRLIPGVLASLLPHLQSCDDDVVYGEWNFIKKDGSFLRHVKSLKWSSFINIHHHCFVASTAAFYRRSSIIDQGFRLREDFHYVMDGEFYAKLSSTGKKFKYLPLTIAEFRLHEHNASQKFLSQSNDISFLLKSEIQHSESRVIRRAYGITFFQDPYLNGLVDGFLWIVAKLYKFFKKL